MQTSENPGLLKLHSLWGDTPLIAFESVHLKSESSARGDSVLQLDISLKHVKPDWNNTIHTKQSRPHIRVFRKNWPRGWKSYNGHFEKNPTNKLVMAHDKITTVNFLLRRRNEKSLRYHHQFVGVIAAVFRNYFQELI